MVAMDQLLSETQYSDNKPLSVRCFAFDKALLFDNQLIAVLFYFMLNETFTYSYFFGGISPTPDRIKRGR